MTNTYPSFSGEVIHGKALGRTIGFPTANLELDQSCSILDDATYGLEGLIQGESYYGIGVYRKNLDLFEAHFFDFSRDIYGEIISITPLFKIRDNMRFSGLETLKMQIEKDKDMMLQWIESHIPKQKITYIAIAAMAKNRIIGNEGKIPWYIPEDFKHFRETTVGYPIIMGRKTFESIGRVLPGRENIVLTRGDFAFPLVTVVHSIEELDTYLISKETTKAYICGGSQIYEEFFKRGKADEVILSVVDMIPDGDTAFPYFEEEFTKMSQDKREGFTIEHWVRGHIPHQNPHI